VQLIRNGEVVRAWDLHARRLVEWRTSFDIAEDRFAWYCVRVLSTGGALQAPGGLPSVSPEIAVAGPVYFLPAGFRRPAATPARVALTVADSASGAPLAATVDVRDDGATVARKELPTGAATLVVPATASLRITAPGYQAAERCLYVDCPEIFAFCRDTGGVWPSFTSSETYQSLRDLLGKLTLAVSLTRQAP
jgi:hypothetical protein